MALEHRGGKPLRRQRSRTNTNGQLTYGPAWKEARPEKGPQGRFCPFSRSRPSLVTAEMMEDPSGPLMRIIPGNEPDQIRLVPA